MKRSLKDSPLVPLVPLAMAAVFFAVGLVQAPSAAAADAAAAKGKAPSLEEKIARGKYLVSTAGCHDCHTPWKEGPNGPEPDMTRALSGHPQDFKLPPAPKPEGPWIVSTAATNTAFAGPWGVTHTANLTPDPETGLGKWTLRNFVDTIRSGRRTGRGREILPPMPIQVYKNFNDADLEAIYRYLQSIPAIKNGVPEPLPPAQKTAAK